MAGIELRSVAFNDHDTIPRQYTKDGADISPPLDWSGVPAGAVELVLVCEDPDAPTGTFRHWLVAGIDPRSGGVEEGRIPPGGREYPNGFGEVGWGGPRPPVGDPPHRYFFRLFALREPSATRGDDPSGDTVRSAADGLDLASGNLVGVYER